MKVTGFDYPDYPQRTIVRGSLSQRTRIYAYTAYEGFLYSLEVNGEYWVIWRFKPHGDGWEADCVVPAEPGTMLFGDLLMETLL